MPRGRSRNRDYNEEKTEDSNIALQNKDESLQSAGTRRSTRRSANINRSNNEKNSLDESTSSPDSSTHDNDAAADQTLETNTGLSNQRSNRTKQNKEEPAQNVEIEVVAEHKPIDTHLEGPSLLNTSHDVPPQVSQAPHQDTVNDNDSTQSAVVTEPSILSQHQREDGILRSQPHEDTVRNSQTAIREADRLHNSAHEELQRESKDHVSVREAKLQHDSQHLNKPCVDPPARENCNEPGMSQRQQEQKERHLSQQATSVQHNPCVEPVIRDAAHHMETTDESSQPCPKQSSQHQTI